MLRNEEICGICIDKHDTPIKVPECGHTFCQNCIVEMLKNKITHQLLVGLVCPQTKCNTVLDDTFLRQVLPPSLYLRFCDVAYRRNNVEGLQDDEIMIDCVNGDCKAKWIIWRDADSLDCLLCKKKFCLKCRDTFHDSNINCDIAQGIISKTKEDQEITIALLSRGLTQCPYCRFIVEKAEGCNFMTCFSLTCLGKKYFCYRCGAKILAQDSGNHYEGQDSFKGKCKVFDPVKAQWTLKLSFKQIKRGIKSFPNRLPCPGCKTKDSKICDFNKNLKHTVCICQSQECQGSIYCILCSYKFKYFEAEFSDHFNEKMQCAGSITIRIKALQDKLLRRKQRRAPKQLAYQLKLMNQQEINQLGETQDQLVETQDNIKPLSGRANQIEQIEAQVKFEQEINQGILVQIQLEKEQTVQFQSVQDVPVPVQVEGQQQKIQHSSSFEFDNSLYGNLNKQFEITQKSQEKSIVRKRTKSVSEKKDFENIFQ